MGYFNVRVRPKRGEIYWIEKNAWKDNNLEIQQKERPGIIVSSDEFNDKGKTYEIVYLTTNPKNDEKTHCTIRSTAKVSTALCEEITSISSEQLGTCLGKCTKEELATIDSCLMISLGLETKKESATGQFTYDTAPEEPASTTTAASTMDPEDDDCMDVAAAELWQENKRLETELAKAEGKVELLLSMYNELLAKSSGIKEFDNPAKNL